MKNNTFSLKKLWPFLIFLSISLVARLIHIQDSLFFTWDQGRDFFAIQKIVEGDLTLIGPTSGIEGFYLGPAWFYLGVPGYIISQGNPYIFTLWYIFVTLSAIPLFWLLGKELFPKNKSLAQTTAYFLSLIPGGIWGTIRVWNPMIAIPLMIAVFLCLTRVKKSRLYIALSFFLVGIVLQAEFAYGVFIVLGLAFILPWLRSKFSFKDYLVGFLSLGITLVPQIIFDLKNNFLLSKTLINGALFPQGEQITWEYHLSKRPGELLSATRELILGGASTAKIPFFLFILVLIVGAIAVFKKSQQNITSTAWKLLVVLAILPYPFYMLWKGNHGYFFGYYITSHFIFLVPLFVKGISHLSENILARKLLSADKLKMLGVAFVGFCATFWYQSLDATTLNPINNAGMKKMDQSIVRILEWIKKDGENPGVVRIFTPNAQTEHYDAILHWRAKDLDLNIPSTVKTDQDQRWYVLIEPDHQLDKRLAKWYLGVSDGKLVAQEYIGVLRLEKWQKVGLEEVE